jgi:hypothetical protein
MKYCKNCKYIIHFYGNHGSSFDFCKVFRFYENGFFRISETAEWNKKGYCLAYKRKWWKFWVKER